LLVLDPFQPTPKNGLYCGGNNPLRNVSHEKGVHKYCQPHLFQFMHASQLLVGDGKAFYKYNGVCTEKLAFFFFKFMCKEFI